MRVGGDGWGRERRRGLGVGGVRRRVVRRRRPLSRAALGAAFGRRRVGVGGLASAAAAGDLHALANVVVLLVVGDAP